MRERALYLLLVLMVAGGASVSAQTPDGNAQQPSAEPTSHDSGWIALAKRWFQPGDAVPRFTIVFGGIKPGSGAALGPAVAYSFRDGSFVQVQAEYSIHHYKLLQTRFQSRPYGPMHAMLSSRVRWQDAPSVALYELGADAPAGRALYGERKTEYGGELTIRPTPITRVAAGLGYERFTLDHGSLNPREDERLTFVPQLPGLGMESAFAHTYLAGGIDTRPSGDVSRRGSRLNGAVHVFSDQSGTSFSFSQYVLEGEKLFPVADERGAVSVAGNLWTSRGTTVPFFLMPTLGGGDYLRGYRTYRFRDRDAGVLTAQFQWGVHEYVDAVAFVDAGRVAPRLSAISVRTLLVTEGIGVRVRTPQKTVFRMDVARSVEGLQLLIGFSSRASSVF